MGPREACGQKPGLPFQPRAIGNEEDVEVSHLRLIPGLLVLRQSARKSRL
jgi:hypothetical protein